MASRSSAYFHLLSSYFLAPAAALEAWTCGPLIRETDKMEAGSQQQGPSAGSCGMPTTRNLCGDWREGICLVLKLSLKGFAK